VRPEHRRLGVFRRLYEHVHRLARDEGQAVGLRLYVEQNNVRAHKAYEQAGMANAGYFVMEEMFEPSKPAPS
jgi:ribosomal protein S18 acetylase RimI-like enzyme